MQSIINTLMSIWAAIKAFFVDVWVSLWNIVNDLAIFLWDSLLVVVDGVVGAIIAAVAAFNAVSLNTLFAVLPHDVAVIASLCNVPAALAVIGAAALVKLTKDILLALLP